MTLLDWLREAVENHGKDWAVNNYRQACEDLGRNIPISSFSRSVQLVVEERTLQGKSTNYGEIMESADVDTPEKSELYHDVDPMRWKPKKLKTATWGNERSPNTYTRMEYDVREEPTPEDFASSFRRMAERHAPRYPELSRPATPSGVTAEVAIMDHHVGRATWDSPEEAREAFMDALSFLVRPYRPGEFERIIFPIGNDFLNWDTWNQGTTQGTPMPGGPRPDEAIGIGLEALKDGIDALTLLADVEVVVVPGNHDYLLSHMLGVALQAWYRHSPHVTVDADLEDWKFRTGAGWLLALTHGKAPENRKALTPQELSAALPLKAPQMWAGSTYREVQVGHLHHKSKGYADWVKDENGVVVRRISSLSKPGRFEEAGLYNGYREAELFVFDGGGPYETRAYRP